MATFKYSKRKLLLSYIDGGNTFEALSIILKENYQLSEENLCFIISDIQSHIIPSFNKRWMQASRKKDGFFNLRTVIGWILNIVHLYLTQKRQLPNPHHLLLLKNAEDRACLIEIRQNPAKKEKIPCYLRIWIRAHL